MLSCNKKNVLTFKPKGFTKNLDLTFPDGGLSVCSSCKRNCKTKHHCRSRDAHNGIPTRETFICLILDHSCTDESQRLKDVSFDATRITCQPCRLRIDQLDCSLPVCSLCEKKNYSRAHCRLKKKHRDMPWTTTYFFLTVRNESTEKQEQGCTNVCYDLHDGSRFQNNKRRRVDIREGQIPMSVRSIDGVSAFDDMVIVPSSRSLLVRISPKRNTLDSLDLDPNVFSNLSLSNARLQSATYYQKGDLSSPLKVLLSDQIYDAVKRSGIETSFLPQHPPRFSPTTIGEVLAKAVLSTPARSRININSLKCVDMNHTGPSDCASDLPEENSFYDTHPVQFGALCSHDRTRTQKQLKLNKMYSHLCYIYDELNAMEYENRKRKSYQLFS